MSQTALGGNWYRAADIRPRLRAHAQMHRHRYRDQVWHVLQDHQTGRFFRVSPAANMMLCLMDGRRTLQQIWDLAGTRFGADRPTRDEAMRLLVQLHQSDLLHTELPPDMAELARRADRQRDRSLLGWVRSPMAMRFPLLDPDRFLNATAWIVRPAFSRVGFLVWLALVLTGSVMAILHWPELSSNVSDRVLTTGNVLLLILIYPAIKALHELGHAYATKLGGGEVHDIGLMLLVFLPVPYVDATAAHAFRSPWRRALVGSAGVMVELALAAIAAIVWINVGPGLVRAAAFNVMLIGGISTLLFNGNPLLRFDGYYVLADLVGIPDLDQRSKKYLVYLSDRYLLGLNRAESPVLEDGERAWFVFYGLSAFFYRLFVTLGIALLVSKRYFAFGVMLAILSAIQMIVWPLFKALRFLVSGQRLRGRRRRAGLVLTGSAGLMALVLFVAPMPYATVVEGVVWVPEDAMLRARADGFARRPLIAPGAWVEAGTPVLVFEDPVAAAQTEVLRSELQVLQIRFGAVNQIDKVQTRLVGEQVSRAAARLARAEQRLRDLSVLAPRAGTFVLPDARTIEGQFVRNGDLVGYVVAPADPLIRAVVPQTEIDVVRGRTVAVALRFTEDVMHAVPARLVREVPAALERPPAAALSEEGGGPILLDPTSPKRDRPLERFYEVALTPAEPLVLGRIGGRVYVRFDHGMEPLAWRGLRELRQMMIRVLDA